MVYCILLHKTTKVVSISNWHSWQPACTMYNCTCKQECKVNIPYEKNISMCVPCVFIVVEFTNK
jgi:hypothetical protein